MQLRIITFIRCLLFILLDLFKYFYRFRFLFIYFNARFPELCFRDVCFPQFVTRYFCFSFIVFWFVKPDLKIFYLKQRIHVENMSFERIQISSVPFWYFGYTILSLVSTFICLIILKHFLILLIDYL